MKNLYQRMSLIMLLALGAFISNAYADHLTPEEALRRVEASSPRKAMAAQGASRLSLAYTQCEQTTDQAMVYVFGHADGKAGFMVLAADDVVGDIVLGYSSDNSFDPANIPPSMQWLLGAYSEYVSRAATAPKTFAVNGEARRAPKAGRHDIEPLVKTHWSQTDPYFNNCPVVNGRHCVTGCVATAMAQIMKYHEWPVQGVGSYTHTFEWDGTTYTTSADFGATTYDWANMTDTYSSKSTDAEKAAVATLMHHCGVASRMAYSPGSSGTNDIVAGGGMINYFNYDKSMRYMRRMWFTNDEWDEAVYSQLDNNMPVMYSGLTANFEGHEFVCDGYSATDGLYHINWGWAYGDGYFMLSNLTPGQQGTGGSSDGAGFNFDQSILTNIQPDAGSPLTVTLFLDGDFLTDKAEYVKADGETVRFSGGVYSGSLANITVNLGLQITGSMNGIVPIGNAVELPPFNGRGGFSLSASSLPVGEYDIRIVYSTDGKATWQPVYYNLEKGDHLHLIVDDTTVRSTTHEVAEEITPEGYSERVVAVDEADGNEFFTGHEYDFVYSVKAEGEWKGQLACVLFGADGNLVTMSETQDVTVDDKTGDLTFRMTMPDEPGVYQHALVYNDGTYLVACSQSSQIRVVEALPANAFALPTYNLSVARGYLPYASANGHVSAASQANAGRYALLQLPAVTRAATDECYIYCVDNGKFISSADFNNTDCFIDAPDGSFTMTPIGETGKFILASKSTGHYLQFGGSNQLLINGWSTLDEGNQWTVAEVGKFDARGVYTALGWQVPTDVATSVDGVAGAAAGSVFNLSGQAVVNARRGLYIVDGKKVVVK